MDRPLVWFRSDLRTLDNTALHYACHAGGLPPPRGVIGVFNLSPGEWIAHDVANVRLDLMRRTLAELSKSLEALNIPLCFIQSATPQGIPKTLVAFAKKHACDGIVFNREYELNEARRDAAVIEAFKAAGLAAQPLDDQTILKPGTVLTKQDRAFTVFTPFKKRWMQLVQARSMVLGKPAKQAALPCKPDAIPAPEDFRIAHTPIAASQRSDAPTGAGASSAPEIPDSLWPAGEKHAMKRLAAFTKARILEYKDDRNHPAVDGTSTLSPYLTIGAISARQCFEGVLETGRFHPQSGDADTGDAGPAQWATELVWREFYHHLLFHFPKLSMGCAFQPATERLKWSYDEKLFERWCTGRTGVPIVDAAMRQLNTTGWMHNRCRMIVAMYLTKDYFIDWRWGEKYFMQRLVDGNLASNNGGWQWSASTGTDAAPYFRIFNPWTQSENCDARGEYIRRYCPELRGLDDKFIHDPEKLPFKARAALDYPKPAVDHKKARDRVMTEFKRIKERA